MRTGPGGGQEAPKLDIREEGRQNPLQDQVSSISDCVQLRLSEYEQVLATLSQFCGLVVPCLAENLPEGQLGEGEVGLAPGSWLLAPSS